MNEIKKKSKKKMKDQRNLMIINNGAFNGLVCIIKTRLDSNLSTFLPFKLISDPRRNNMLFAICLLFIKKN